MESESEEPPRVMMKHCPEVFRVEEDDTLTVLMDQVPDELRAKAQEAERLAAQQDEVLSRFRSILETLLQLGFEPQP